MHPILRKFVYQTLASLAVIGSTLSYGRSLGCGGGPCRILYGGAGCDVELIVQFQYALIYGLNVLDRFQLFCMYGAQL